MFSNSYRLLSIGVAAALIAACGGGSGGSGSMGSTPPATPQTANVAVMLSDASTEDWSNIGVKVLSIALIPQGGGSNVTVYTAPAPAPVTNLAQLDDIADLLENATVAVGTYTGAVLTISGNPGDILLIASPDPEAGFAAAAGATIPTNQIQVQHTQGSGSGLTVPVTVNFVSPLVVGTTQNNVMDLEFDLSHPALLIAHVPVAGGGTIWAVNFDGPVRCHPVHDLTRLVLRHMYGDVTAVSTDTISITKEFPTEPPANPETAVAGTQSLQITADGVNGTIFYDLDAKTKTVIDNFTNEMSLVGKYVRVAARYQQDGTLVATRIWASSSFNNVWVSPEGHVLHVNAANDTVTVANELGQPVVMTVNADTQFFFREPQDPTVDSNPIGVGTGFLSSKDLVRGFKVHASVVDPLAVPLVAQSIDIETARYDGAISFTSPPNDSSFTYTRNFHTVTDDYVYPLDYISSSTPNGTDDSGTKIDGYKWWNFAYPTQLTSGANAIGDFVAAAGSVNFGGTVNTMPTYGVSFATWNDSANAGGWAAAASILIPSTLPLGTVASNWTLTGYDLSFGMTVLGGPTPATVNVSTQPGSATLVYQVDRTNGIVTVSPIDITSSAGLLDLQTALAVGAPVRLYAVPQVNDNLKVYVLAYFTGDMPAM